MLTVSIVIPVYNSSKYLTECLESIINQTYRNIEIICINDESTDNSLDILKEYEKSDNRIKVYSKKNERMGGAASARNMGLEKASGDYICFLDADDFFEHDMIEKMVKKAIDTKAEVVICSAKQYDDVTKEIRNYDKIELDYAPDKLYFSYKDCSQYIFQISEMIVWNKLFDIKLIRDNNLFFEPIPISDDQYLPALALVKAKRIAIVDERFVNYRINTGSSQVDSQAKHPEAAYQATYSIVKKLKEYGVYEEVRQSYINITLRLNRLYFDRMRSYESLKLLYDKFRDDVWPMLGAIDLSKDYFYDERLWEWYETIMNNSLEEILFSVSRGYGAEMTTGILRFQVPYERIAKGNRIVLVGKGLTGRYWYSQLLLSNYAEVVAWVDYNEDIPNDLVFDEILEAK